jgi:glycosyltransferase involved in cell wall biosynthesis
VLAGALELFLVALGLIYFVAMTASGLRVIRLAHRQTRPHRRARSQPGEALVRSHRGPAAPGRLAPLRAKLDKGLRFLWHKAVTADQPPARAGVLVDATEYVVYFIVPCLNEERVIAESVANLLADPRGIVVVVDDASEDRTGRLAASIDPERVIVVRRELPDARRGKGPALNAGFARVLQDAAVRGVAPSRIIICVMDADGRLSDGALDAVLPLFSDQSVGGVQLPVRIRRVKGSVLTLLQDLEFWGVCAIAQLGRISSGTVSLGGNGQFTRFNALLELGTSPWRAQLTEDLDLALALATAGWRLTSTPLAYVSQQGLANLRRLIHQRTRWYQGHMQAGRWMGKLWLSRRLPHLAMLELTLYLLVPWALVLPWSIIFNYNLVLMALWVAGWVAEPGLGATLTERIITVVIWYSASCVPIWMAGYLYSRQRRKSGPFRALLLGHLLLLGNYITYVACWRAFFRLVVGANNWQKTERHRERSHRAGGRLVPAEEQALAAATAGPLAAFGGEQPGARPAPRVVIPAPRGSGETGPRGSAETAPTTRPAETAPARLPAERPPTTRPAGRGGQRAKRAGQRPGSHRAPRERTPAGRR